MTVYTLTNDSLLLTPKILSSIYFDSNTKRYKWRISDNNLGAINERFVSKDVVRALIDAKLEDEKAELIKYSDRIKAGEIGVYQDVANRLKNIHILEVAKIKDGFENITQADLGTMGSQLKKQYHTGKDPLTGKPFGLKYMLQEAPNQSIAQIENRLRMFAESGNISASVIDQSGQVLAGKTAMKRILGKTDMHCNECVQYASYGWQPIGALPLPMVRCSCRTNCLCKVIYQ